MSISPEYLKVRILVGSRVKSRHHSSFVYSGEKMDIVIDKNNKYNNTDSKSHENIRSLLPGSLMYEVCKKKSYFSHIFWEKKKNIYIIYCSKHHVIMPTQYKQYHHTNIPTTISLFGSLNLFIHERAKTNNRFFLPFLFILQPPTLSSTI